MKRLALFVLLLTLCGAVSAQEKIDSLPYQRFPTVPPLQLLLTDSVTVYTKDSLPKKKPVLVFFFSPGCGHCQHTTEELVKRRDSLPEMTIVMASFGSIGEIRDFTAKYHADQLPNTVIGKDVYFLLPPFFGITHLPHFAYYDRKGRFLQTFDGATQVPKLLEEIRVLNTRKK